MTETVSVFFVLRHFSQRFTFLLLEFLLSFKWTGLLVVLF
jgi:hypothetical protein